MKEVGLVILGWALGLASSIGVDWTKKWSRRKTFLKALRTELEDLQIRLAIASLKLLQSYGTLDRDFLDWIAPLLDRYSGGEKIDSIRRMVNHLQTGNPEVTNAAHEMFRAGPGMGSSVNKFSAGFLETHLQELPNLPMSLQRKIHEVMFHLSTANQEAEKIEPRIIMTFDNSLTQHNRDILNEDLNHKYIYLQKRYRRTAEGIEDVLAELVTPASA